MHANTHPEAIVDKNGVTTTRHKTNSAVTIPARLLPSLNKAITTSTRVASSTPEERLNFDGVTLLVHEMNPEAETISVVEVEDMLLLAAIDDKPVNNEVSIISGTILKRSGASSGVYKLSATVNKEKWSSAYTKDVLRSNLPSEDSLMQGGLTPLAGTLAYAAARWGDNADELERLSEIDSNLIHAVIVLNPATSEDTINKLATSEDPSVRAFVARKSQDPSIVSMLSRDASESVRGDAIRREMLTAEDVDWVYRNSKMELVRSHAIEHPNASPLLVRDAFDNDWSARVVFSASKRFTEAQQYPLWKNETTQSFIKDDELKKSTKPADDYVRSVVGNSDVTPPVRIITDDEARAIAWRITSRMSNGGESFKALNGGRNFPLQGLVSDAAYVKSLTINQRSYGLKWDSDQYMNAIIGWARTKQGIKP